MNHEDSNRHERRKAQALARREWRKLVKRAKWDPVAHTALLAESRRRGWLTEDDILDVSA